MQDESKFDPKIYFKLFKKNQYNFFIFMLNQFFKL